MRQGSAAEHLGAELENIVHAGQKITLPLWPDGLGWEFASPSYDDVDAALGTDGSNNHAPEALGCRYSVDFRERRWDRKKESGEFFAKGREMWCGTEIDSAIYTYMPGHTVLEIAHVSRLIGDTEIHAAAMAWLEYLGARNEEFRSPRTGRIITVGDRCAGPGRTPGGRTWQDHFVDLGMGRRAESSEKILLARADLVREAMADIRERRRTPLQKLRELGIKTLVPVRVVEAPGIKAVWRNGERWNRNTQPVCAGVEVAGHEHYAPENRGFTTDEHDPKHRAKGAPTVTETPTSIVYVSPIYAAVTLAIPPREQRTLDV
ncbi:MAG: hypothetical protein ABI639_17435, partial [Thermoanaerobaculia bacterium]